MERLKSEYAKLQEAIHLSTTENLELKYWDFNQPNNALFEQYIAKYLKITDKQTMQKNGTLGITYKQSSGKPEVDLTLMKKPASIYTNTNGAQYIVSNQKITSGLMIILDTNGVKGPNQFGKDVFYSRLDKSHPEDFCFMGKYANSEVTFDKEPNGDRQVLLGNKNPKSSTLSKNLSYACSKKARGMWCGHLIQLDGWKIEKDYPW